MPAAFKTLAARTVATSGICLMALACGCNESDQVQAERRVEAALQDVRVLRGQEKVAAAEKVVADAGDSNAARATARAALGQAQLEQAIQQINELERQQIELLRLIGEAQQAAVSLRGSTLVVEHLNRLEPSNALQRIDEQIAQARGGGDQAAWFTHDQTRLLTLASAKAEIDRLTGEIEKLNQQISQLEQQRQQAAQQANQLFIESEKQSGRQSVETFKQASELRKKAADLASQIETVRESILPLQGDLESAQAQQKALEDAIAQMESRKQQVQAAWDATQKLAQQQVESAKKLYAGGAYPAAQGDSQTTGALEQILRQLEEQTGQFEQAAGQIQDLLSKTADNFQQAHQAAAAYVTQLSGMIDDPNNRQRPERTAWQSLRKLYNPMAHQLQAGKAARLQGDVSTAQAAIHAQRAVLAQLLEPSLKQVGIASAQAMGTPQALADQAKQAYASAVEQYKLAAEKFENFETAAAATNELKNSARVELMLALYSWAQLDRSHGSDASAKGNLARATQLSQELSSGNVPLPGGLPPELVPAAAPSSPSTPPSDGGAPTESAPPAEESTPAQEPAAG